LLSQLLRRQRQDSEFKASPAKAVQRPCLKKQNENEVRCQRLMPVILAVWEAEIRKIEVPGQPGQKSLQDITSTKQSWE
jgi:hypothetical protein